MFIILFQPAICIYIDYLLNIKLKFLFSNLYIINLVKVKGTFSHGILSFFSVTDCITLLKVH